MHRLNLFHMIFSYGLLVMPSMAIAVEVNRDYEYQTPIPAIKQVTIRKPLSALPRQKLFAPCLGQSTLTEFAESTNFLVMVCRDRLNPSQKFWIQKNKVTGRIISLKAEDKPRSQPVPWESGNYTFSLYADGVGRGNAYLEIYNTKTKIMVGEALLYHYDNYYRKNNR
ncbi:MAG: hypothetical protein NW214_12485 [Pseudanabaenaceae cyanobacterium bins.39]|nr:hypothetical protein [Pseudanabaenaceae cyanobacterium bins.39]